MFKYCPQCSEQSPEFSDNKQISCRLCGFTYFHNAPASVMCILVYDSKILMAVRNRDPEKGFLDLVGGFIDPGENAEQAMSRELKEELGIDVSTFTYLGSASNDYLYKDILYKTCDLVYLTELQEIPTDFDTEEIKELRLLHPDEINKDEIGFKSVPEALKLYQQVSKK